MASANSKAQFRFRRDCYPLTPIWTWQLMQTSVSCLTGAFNSVLPILLGIFTAWFQRWYPAHYAASDK